MSLQRTDFLLDKIIQGNLSGDFPLQDTVINGVWQDTPYGNSDAQHIEDIIIYDIGWLKQNPTFGFGAFTTLNSENTAQSAMRKLTINCNLDGYNVSSGAIVPDIKKGLQLYSKFITRQ